ncbi:MAG: DUF1467 family protein [Aestuariivirgaceae bacterium]|nr:DUF1467 family protein [Aestuariivirgaceae bacterium]
MKISSAIAVYFIMWWLTLFMVLPWGSRSAHEAGTEVGAGHAPSAPLHARMRLKVLATTLIASAFFAGFYWMMTASNLTLDDIWFLPDFTPKL